MLSHIHIKNFAIIEEIDTSFDSGLTMITGETGSGKSIIIEAISLVLGSRADNSFVRTGADKALVEVSFDDCPNFIFDELGESAEEYENQLIIQRELTSQGKSTCKINGKLVPLSTLRQISSHLADIHGQYDHQSLLNEDLHINFLDLYGSAEVKKLKEQLEKEFPEYQRIKAAYEKLLADEDAARAALELKMFELAELEKANLREGEDEELYEQINLLQNSEKIFGNFADSYNLLYGNAGSVIEKLGQIKGLLAENADFNEKFATFAQISEDAYYKLEDLASEIRNSRDKIDFSEGELEDLIIRETELKMLMRKYRKSLPDLIKYRDSLAFELAENTDIDSQKENLFNKYTSFKQAVLSTSSELSALRQKIASSLEADIERELAELSFNNAKFSVAFDTNAENLSACGIDKVQFLLSANRGTPAKPLAKIASGGEMSRIMLAFKNILADFDQIPTMIFDEIDTGISGIAASVVASKLRQIAKSHQIICITHLPQIAASGDTNFEIRKSSDDSSTRVELNKLSEEEKINEIARLLGGKAITDVTLKSAEELISASR